MSKCQTFLRRTLRQTVETKTYFLPIVSKSPMPTEFWKPISRLPGPASNDYVNLMRKSESQSADDRNDGATIDQRPHPPDAGTSNAKRAELDHHVVATNERTIYGVLCRRASSSVSTCHSLRTQQENREVEAFPGSRGKKSKLLPR